MAFALFILQVVHWSSSSWHSERPELSSWLLRANLEGKKGLLIFIFISNVLLVVLNASEPNKFNGNFIKVIMFIYFNFYICFMPLL